MPDDAPSAIASPAGRGDYEVQPGDCIASIALAHGFFWKTLWDLPANEPLRNARGDGHVLLPGDRVTIPALTTKDESAPAEQKHRFRRLGVPAKLKIKVVAFQPDGDEPQGSRSVAGDGAEVTIREPAARDQWSQQALRDARWVLTVDGVQSRGTTDSQGMVEAWISPGAREGRLVVDPGGEHERVIEFSLGTLDPEDSPRGRAQRLKNLGFGAAEAGDPSSLAEATEGFQHVRGMTPTGEPDAETLDALKEAHGV